MSQSVDYPTKKIHKLYVPTNDYQLSLDKDSFIKNENFEIQYCPDIHFQCNNNQTCCKLPDMMGYGCCPIANAVCCIDGIHCCPPGNICDVEKGECKTKDRDIVYSNKERKFETPDDDEFVDITFETFDSLSNAPLKLDSE